MKIWLTTLALVSALLAMTHAQDREWYRINYYELTSEEKAEEFDRAFEALIGILKQEGRSPIGVFKPVEKEDQPDGEKKILRYMISTLKGPEEIVSTPQQFHQYGQELLPALDYLTSEKNNPAFTRIQSSLLYAFEGMPKHNIPGEPKEGSKRLFELRIYESHNELKGRLKVEMFNQGEIDIFKEVGLDAVFFGEAVAGPNLPNLTYLLVYDDDAHRERVWKAFLEAESWKKLSQDERYADTVSKIISVHLEPTDYSQIQ